METVDDIESSKGLHYSTIDVGRQKRIGNLTSPRQNLTPYLPQRSRSMMNLSSSNNVKRHSWLLPESPTVTEKQSQLTKRKGISGALSSPPPKTPSIERYLEIFDKLKNTYSDFICSWETADQTSLSMKDKHLYDKFTKKLILKLQKIEDLRELYVHQEHMRKGAENLLATLEREISKKVKNGKDYCKMNLKKNLTRLCAIEDEINDMAGSLRIQVIGLIGFARLSPGDVYCVQFKHGYENFSSKCKVVGQGQKWTNASISVKIDAANDLKLKVSEVRKINTNVVGHITCPIANFLSQDGQEFFLPVNSTGTIKLKISTFWSPFSNKDETTLYSKLNLIGGHTLKVDTLSENSLTPSSSSTPKNGTLSSMPSLITSKGTLTSMKISVNGMFLSPEASVIKHSRADNGGVNIVDGKASNWSASVTAKSLPDIAKCCENETMDENKDEIDSVTDNNNKKNSGLVHAVSCDVLNENVILRDSDFRDKRKPRPVTLGPTYTNGFSCRSDYENVANLITTSILDQKPDVVPSEDSKIRSKGRPKSLVVQSKPIPAPDYPADIRLKSPEQISVRSMPVIEETKHSPPHTSPPTPPQLAEEEEEIVFGEEDEDGDDLIGEIKTILLNAIIKCNECDTDVMEVKIVKNALNHLLNLFQEKKKPISRTPSVENALNSIDSAFDFLSEHQTMKPEKNKEARSVEICARNWKLLRQALRLHLKAVYILINKLLILESPLNIKREAQIDRILAQVPVLSTLNESLISEDEITPKSVASSIEKTKFAGTSWEKHCSKNEFICNKHRMISALSEMYAHFHPGNNISDEVCNEILARIQDQNIYEGDLDSVSIFQFAIFIKRVKNLAEYFDTVSKEKKLHRIFRSNDDLVLMSTIQDRNSVPLVPSALKIVATLLKNANKTVQRLAVDFLTKLPLNKKDEVIEIYLSMLEDDDEHTRETVCFALKYLEACKAQESLTYLWKNDVECVRKAAFEALKVVGFPSEIEPTDEIKKFQYCEVSTKF